MLTFNVNLPNIKRWHGQKVGGGQRHEKPWVLVVMTTLILSFVAPLAGAQSTIDTALQKGCLPQWHSARLTNYTSYPEPGSEECLVYNGCTWAGQFYGLPDRQMPESWVSSHNIVAVHMKDWAWLQNKTLRLRQGHREVFVRVYDVCADEDCDGCCTKNLDGKDHLIDIEKFTMARFGSGEGDVQFQVCR